MLRYAITSRALFPGDDRQQLAALLRQSARWAAEGIDIIQLREKDLPSGTLAALARDILRTLHGTPTRLLINSRPDIAIAASAHGVHLTATPGELTPAQVRLLYSKAALRKPLITISCHSTAEVERAQNEKPDVILFAPVFEKSITGRLVAPGVGLNRLHEACVAAAPIPVCALGGITRQNTFLCLKAGASGIAGIRLFHTPRP